MMATLVFHDHNALAHWLKLGLYQTQTAAELFKVIKRFGVGGFSCLWISFYLFEFRCQCFLKHIHRFCYSLQLLLNRKKYVIFFILFLRLFRNLIKTHQNLIQTLFNRRLQRFCERQIGENWFIVIFLGVWGDLCWSSRPNVTVERHQIDTKRNRCAFILGLYRLVVQGLKNASYLLADGNHGSKGRRRGFFLAINSPVKIQQSFPIPLILHLTLFSNISIDFLPANTAINFFFLKLPFPVMLDFLIPVLKFSG